MSKFDVAIEWLAEAAACLPEDEDEIEAAIRILKAAAKVDKTKARSTLSWVDSPFDVAYEGRDSLHAFVEALPDEEEK